MEIHVTAVETRNARKVMMQVWVGSPSANSGICTTAHLSRAEALKLARRLTEAANELPPEATAADLGVAA